MTLRLVVPIACLTAAVPVASAIAATRPTGVVETCSGQSSASFPRAFTNDDNLVVGPLVMIGGGRLTSPETVRRFNGNKFPLLVAAGHRVTIELTRPTRRFAALGYGPLPEGRRLTAGDGHRVVTFRSCDRAKALSDAAAGRSRSGRGSCWRARRAAWRCASGSTTSPRPAARGWPSAPAVRMREPPRWDPWSSPTWRRGA
jgi:hypothetical protein